MEWVLHNPKATRDDVARVYGDALYQGVELDWGAVNRRVRERWSMSAVVFVQRRARWFARQLGEMKALHDREWAHELLRKAEDLLLAPIRADNWHDDVDHWLQDVRAWERERLGS